MKSSTFIKETCPLKKKTNNSQKYIYISTPVQACTACVDTVCRCIVPPLLAGIAYEYDVCTNGHRLSISWDEMAKIGYFFACWVIFCWLSILNSPGPVIFQCPNTEGFILYPTNVLSVLLSVKFVQSVQTPLKLKLLGNFFF